MENFTERVLAIVQKIPPGKVMSYGQIARFAGNPRGARQVSRILHSMSGKYNLPWHRVLNAKGEIGLQDEESFYTQKLKLESEGILFIGRKKIELGKFQYLP